MTRDDKIKLSVILNIISTLSIPYKNKVGLIKEIKKLIKDDVE